MRRLRWLLLGLYVVLVASCVALVIRSDPNDTEWVAACLFFVCFAVVCQVIFIGLRGRREYLMPARPRRRVPPAIVAGLMMTVLLASLSLAMYELTGVGDGWPRWVLYCGLGGLWLGWGAFFYVQCRRIDRFDSVRRMTKWLLAGSLLQLFSTIPSHIIVTRRPGCFVGMYTMMGIFGGLFVMIWAFGPGLALLFHQEMRMRMAGHCPACGYNLRGLPEPRCSECGRPFTFREVRMSQEQLGVGILET